MSVTLFFLGGVERKANARESHLFALSACYCYPSGINGGEGTAICHASQEAQRDTTSLV